MHVNCRDCSTERNVSAHADVIDGSLNPASGRRLLGGESQPRECLSCENFCVHRYLWVILRQLPTFFHHNVHKSCLMGAMY